LFRFGDIVYGYIAQAQTAVMMADGTPFDTRPQSIQFEFFLQDDGVARVGNAEIERLYWYVISNY
jgi:hypothetical protein